MLIHSGDARAPAFDVTGKSSVNWAKTDAGQIEVRAPRDPLLASPAGMSAIDLQALAPAELTPQTEPCCADGAIGVLPQCVPVPVAAVSWPAATDLPHSPASPDHGQLAAALTQLISTELGLRGFMLTIAVEKARSNAELRSVAQRTIDQIRTHRGDAAATAALRTLDGT